MTRVRIASIEDLPLGRLQRVVLNGVPICVARTPDGDVYAVSDVCSHEEASLSEGELLGFEVECPLHVSRFDVRTGRPVAPPAQLPIKTYGVSIEQGEVYLED